MVAALATCAAAADATGKWSGTFTMAGPDGQPGQPNAAYMVLKQAGTTITGTGGPDETQQFAIEKGKIQGNKITGEVHDSDNVLYKLDLVLDGDHVKGDIAVTTPDGQTINGKVEMTRVK